MLADTFILLFSFMMQLNKVFPALGNPDKKNTSFIYKLIDIPALGPRGITLWYVSLGTYIKSPGLRV